jgi:copper homeostasis protein
MKEKKITLEVCADSVNSALIAQSAGAYRVELCSNLSEGGVTPSPAQIESARKQLNIKLYILIRPRGGDFLYNDCEFEIMKHDIHFCGKCACDGVVIGMLNSDGTVDKVRTKILLDIAHSYNMGVTFHRAFDRSNDLKQAMEDIIELGCERILTSGGAKNAIDGADLIAELIRQAGERISIMPGAGIAPENVAFLLQKTAFREVHGTFRSPFESKMVFRNTLVGTDKEEYTVQLADEQKIKDALTFIE